MRYYTDDPSRRRFGARRDQNGSLLEGAPRSVREDGFGRGPTAEGDWASKFRRRGDGGAAMAGQPRPVAVSGRADADPRVAFLRGQAAKAVQNAPTAPTAPAKPDFQSTSTGTEYRKPDGEYGQTTDFRSKMEARIPGWSGMTPEQRRSALQAAPSAASMGKVVGVETGRSAYVSTSAEEAERIRQKYAAPGSKNGVRQIQRPQGKPQPDYVAPRGDIAALKEVPASPAVPHVAPKWENPGQIAEMKGDTRAVAAPPMAMPTVNRGSPPASRKSFGPDPAPAFNAAIDGGIRKATGARPGFDMNVNRETAAALKDLRRSQSQQMGAAGYDPGAFATASKTIAAGKVDDLDATLRRFRPGSSKEPFKQIAQNY